MQHTPAPHHYTLTDEHHPPTPQNTNTHTPTAPHHPPHRTPPNSTDATNTSNTRPSPHATADNSNTGAPYPPTTDITPFGHQDDIFTTPTPVRTATHFLHRHHPNETLPHTPPVHQRKSPPEQYIVTPHTTTTTHRSVPTHTTNTPNNYQPHTPTFTTTPPTPTQTFTHRHSVPALTNTPFEYHQHQQNITTYATGPDSPPDPTALFTQIFASNPAFAASFMELVHQYKPSPIHLPHLPTAVRESLPPHTQHHQHSHHTMVHMPPPITRQGPAFSPQDYTAPPTALPPHHRQNTTNPRTDHTHPPIPPSYPRHTRSTERTEPMDYRPEQTATDNTA